MKSSTFSLFAIGFLLAAYAGMAYLDNPKSIEQRLQEDKREAFAYCHSEDFLIAREGGTLYIKCLRPPRRYK